MQGRLRKLASLAVIVLLGAMQGGCVRLVPESSTPRPTALAAPPPSVSSAIYAGVERGPKPASLKLAPGDAGPAMVSFIETCPKLLAREDKSGLTQPGDWRDACTAATRWDYGKAPAFFESYFETARVGSGEAFVTGYYEPEIAGSRHRRAGFDVPVYAVPSDLVRDWPADTPDNARTGKPPLGRRDANGTFVPYHDRAAIEDGALAGEGLEIAWATDMVEFFFLQVQGSGRLRTPEGEIIRIGYAGQNGRGYASIGALMRQRGQLGNGPGQYPGSMQGIMRYLHEHPVEGRALMRENKSWVFLRELTGDGPLGALGVPVRRESSVAADPDFVPLGAPVWLALDNPQASGLWVAQDTGGAIKGANRFDTFWGTGDDARTIAGGMQARGQALILLPKGTLGRIVTP